MKIALVLGGGGAGGWMFHAGVIRSLEHRYGWQASQADVIVGTSAGSSIAAGLTLGASVDDIAEDLDRPPTEEEMRRFRALMADRPRQWRPLAPAMARQVLPGGGGAAVALSGLLPTGRYPTTPLARLADRLGNGQWPDRLWITATSVPDGRTAVFGRDHRDATVGEAIEASSAVPGLMEPKAISGVRYIDGGAVSPTHADLVVGRAPDLAIVSSPMTRANRRPLGALARRRLNEERRLLSAAGVPSVVIEPPADTDRLFRAYPRRDRAAGGAIQRAGQASTEAALRAAGIGRGDLTAH